MQQQKTYKILALDDQPENLEVIVRLTEKIGPEYEVLQELNPRLALEIARAEIPDLIITDWEMPDMDGLEFIQALKNDPLTKEIPVIMCTGIMTTSENLEAALNAGAADYIRKPIDEIELRARLRSILALSDSFKTIKSQKEEYKKLLLNILPKETVEEFLVSGAAKSHRFEQVSVLFTDFKGFTHFAETMSPEVLVKEIDFCFSQFDHIVAKHGLEKIKTIGDAYMCAGGLPLSNSSSPTDVIHAALEIRNFMTNLKIERDKKGEHCFEVRIGINTGPVVAGIVGTTKFQYDIWGDTVNTAARMESSGEVGKINISETTYNLVKDDFEFDYRGKIAAKHKGEINMYFVEKMVPSPLTDPT